jgi:hypothetical protein
MEKKKKKNTYKNTFAKTAFAVMVMVFFALALATCQPELPASDEKAVEYTDVEYDVIGAPGHERVKSVKLYLDGAKVPVTAKQRAIHRALSLESAGASHDFFEVVFWHPTMVSRASWEIGHPAGISNLYRPAPGIDYHNIYNGTAAAPTLPCSAVFVGKKTNKTLLGVGWLTQVDNGKGTGVLTAIDPDTKSVTFTVAPLRTWLGFGGAGGDEVRAGEDVRGPPETGTLATFITSTGGSGAVIGDFTGNTPPSNGRTRGLLAPLPVGDTTVTYPLFALPHHVAPSNGDPVVIRAIYTIGGLTVLTAANASTVRPVAPGAATGHTADSAWPAVRNYGAIGLQVIKRRPRFTFQGRPYEAPKYDSASRIEINITPAGTFPAYTRVADGMFDHTIELNVRINSNSSGLFAFTFQAPVYNITTASAIAPGGNGGPEFTKWFIRPADGPELFLLDNGIVDGGMVLLGKPDDIGDGDWIQIITTGIGFSND